MPDTSGWKGGRVYFDLEFQRFRFVVGWLHAPKPELRDIIIVEGHATAKPFSSMEERAVTRNIFPELPLTFLIHPSMPHIPPSTTFLCCNSIGLSRNRLMGRLVRGLKRKSFPRSLSASIPNPWANGRHCIPFILLSSSWVNVVCFVIWLYKLLLKN